MYEDSNEWNLKKMDAEFFEESEIQQGENWTYPGVEYKFTVRRKPRWMTVYILIPVMVVTMLAGSVFLLPANSYEKTTIAITTLVIITFFLTILPKVQPHSSLGVPMIMKYSVFFGEK